MVAPTPKTWALLDPLNTTNLNGGIRDPIAYAINPPAVIVGRNAAQSIPHNAATLYTFDTEIFDNYAMFAASSTAITIVDDGVYQVTAWANFAANATGIRVCEILYNGTILLSTATPAPSAGDGRLALGSAFSAVAGDVFTVSGFQSSGGALNSFARLSAVRVSGI
jgi:hypothetical protein